MIKLLESKEIKRSIGKNPFDFLMNPKNRIHDGAFVSIGYINDHEISWGPRTRKKITVDNDAKLSEYISNLSDSSFKTALINFQLSDKYQAALASGKTAPFNIDGECHIIKLGRFTVNWKSNKGLKRFYADKGEAIANTRVKHGFGKDESEYPETDWRRNPKYKGVGKYEIAGDPANPNKFKGNKYNQPIGVVDDTDPGSGFWTDADNSNIVIRQIGNPKASKDPMWFFIDADGTRSILDKNLMAFLMYAYSSSKPKDEIKEINQEEQAFLNDLQSIKNFDKSEMTMILDNILYFTGTSKDDAGVKFPFVWVNNDIIQSLYPYIDDDTIDIMLQAGIKKSKADLQVVTESYISIKNRKSLNESKKQINVIMTGSPKDFGYETKEEFLKEHPEYKETTSWDDVDIVFTNDLDSKTGKMKKAEDNGVTVKLYPKSKINESKHHLNDAQQSLYEEIMLNVSKMVKRSLNESDEVDPLDDEDIDDELLNDTEILADIETWVTECLDNWSEGLEHTIEDKEQFDNDINTAEDYFSNNIDEFLEEYGYTEEEYEMNSEDIYELINDLINDKKSYVYDKLDYYDMVNEDEY